MPEDNLLQKFERRLLELGFPAARRQRAVRELADHYEDLKQSAPENGLAAVNVEAWVEGNLGDPRALAEQAVSGLRQSSWWGRHRIIGFCILPLLCFGPAWILGGLLCGLLFWLMEFTFGPAAGIWVKDIMAQDAVARIFLPMFGVALNAGVIGLFAMFFCWLAGRSAAGLKWAIFACAASAIHGFFFHVGLTTHRLWIGYAWKPNWVCAMTPLLVAGGCWLRQRRQESRRLATLTLPLLLVGFLTGCASPKEKPVSQRGWIGGEYKQARQQGVVTAMSASPAVAGCLPKELAAKRAGAILITALSSNTPVATAGLRANDLVLEINNQPVTQLKTFRSVIDGCEPGSTLAVKAYRDGQTQDFRVTVGKETFRRGGVFKIALPCVVHDWDLWPNPGFSLVIVGYEPNPGLRPQCNNSSDVFDEDWKAFVGVFELTGGKRILDQKN